MKVIELIEERYMMGKIGIAPGGWCCTCTCCWCHCCCWCCWVGGVIEEELESD